MKAYAVLGSDDHFVGIWRDRETAEKVMERSAWAKGERIVEMVSAERIAELEEQLRLANIDQAQTEIEAESALAEYGDLMRKYAIDSDESLTECVERNIDGWKQRCWRSEEELTDQILTLRAERDALKAALEVAFDYAMQNISEERQRFAGYKPERHAQWAKDEALMRAALAAKGE